MVAKNTAQPAQPAQPDVDDNGNPSEGAAGQPSTTVAPAATHDEALQQVHGSAGPSAAIGTLAEHHQDVSTAGDEAAPEAPPMAAMTGTGTALLVSGTVATAGELNVLTSPNLATALTALAAADDRHVLGEVGLTVGEGVVALTSHTTGAAAQMQYGDLSHDMEAGNQSGREKRPIATPDGSPMKTSTHTTPQDKKKVRVGVHLASAAFNTPRGVSISFSFCL
jgi:hypothetical protein